MLFHDRNMFNHLNIFFFLYCCSSTVVSNFLTPTPHSPHPHLRPSILPTLALSMCPLYMFLDDPFPSFPHYPPPLWLLLVQKL